MTRYLSSQPRGYDWSSCLTIPVLLWQLYFAFLSLLLFLLFFLSSWDWPTDLCCETHLQHGRVIFSLWQRRFCLQQVRMCWCKQKAVCNSYSTNFEGPYQSNSLCDTYKRGHEAGLWKGNTEDSELVPDPSEAQVRAQVFCCYPFRLAHEAQWDSSPTKSL